MHVSRKNAVVKIVGWVERLSEYVVSRFGDRSYRRLTACRLGRAEGETQQSTERIAKAIGSVGEPNLESGTGGKDYRTPYSVA